MVKLMQLSPNAEDYIKKCCKHEPVKDIDGCDSKACSPFNCCLKTIMLFKVQDEPTVHFIPEYLIKNNFSHIQMLTSLHGGDIWHPPRVMDFLSA